jgi:hypothetical protein
MQPPKTPAWAKVTCIIPVVALQDSFFRIHPRLHSLTLHTEADMYFTEQITFINAQLGWSCPALVLTLSRADEIEMKDSISARMGE